MRGAALLALMALVRGVATAEPTCPPIATLTVFVDNTSGVSQLDVEVEGDLAVDPAGCPGATSYERTLHCAGTGIVRCGTIEGLRPGPWVHRLTVGVPDSAPQSQAQRFVVLGGAPADVSNMLVWTVYPRTFVVASTDPADLHARLAEAAQYTASHEGSALVTFSRGAFPGAADPKRIFLVNPAGAPPCGITNRNRCPPSVTLPAPMAGLCFTGDRIVMDALDDDARAGGVILSVGTCPRQVVRLYGGDNVLRGLAIEGSQVQSPTSQLDALAITDDRAHRNRLEQVRILGPTRGDAVSVGFGAGGDGRDNVIADSEITGAADKGVKVVDGGVVRIERSCLHDNFNGGVQLTTSDTAATRGGSAVAVENVVQHNVGGGAQHGFIAGVEEKQIETRLETRGNVVRFNGARGISVANGAVAHLASDVVTDNYRAGLRLRTEKPGSAPSAVLRGSTFACNYAPGYCVDTAGAATNAICRADRDCGRCAGGARSRCRQSSDCASAGPCVFDVCTLDFCDPGRCGTAGSCCADRSVSTGIGLGLDAPCAGCAVPTIDLGTPADAGRNAVTLNSNPDATGPGITATFNVTSALVTASSIPAVGNQWEHCGDECSAAQVAQLDIRLNAGATPLDLGTLVPPATGPSPRVDAISPPRPRAGELVRVYGGPFNAIDGAACHPAGLPEDPCSAENPEVVARNGADVARGNGVAVVLNGTTYAAPVHQVTPSMLAFAMPVDCDAAGALIVARGNTIGVPAALCDAKGCVGRPAGWPCEDGSACTVDDACDGDGACVGGAPLSCEGVCMTCDPASGCVPKPPGATCREATGRCDVAEVCTGASSDCPPDSFAPPSVACDDANACTADDHCDGTADVCRSVPIFCDDPCLTGVCEPQIGCVARDGAAALTCRVDECERTRLRRRARKLAVTIDQALEQGKTPGNRRMKRLQGLLRRCGLDDL